MSEEPLDGLRILDISEGIAGTYASKLLGDAGGEVIKAMGPEGDPLRWRGQESDRREYPLFSHLHADHAVETIDVADEGGRSRFHELLRWADIVLEGSDTGGQPALRAERTSDSIDPERGTVVVSISPFGAGGPWADRAANEFTLQGWSGKLVTNYAGPADRPPAATGGESGLWLSGTFAAVGALAYHRIAERTGRNVHIDLSTLESMVAVFGQDALSWQLEGRPSRSAVADGPREPQIPGIHAASDGLLAFAVVTAQQWFDFCIMIERPEWIADAELTSSHGRIRRKTEVLRAIEDWISKRSTEEVMELAALLRIPIGVVSNGETSPRLACYSDSFTTDRTNFVRPRSAFRFSRLSGDTSVRGSVAGSSMSMSPLDRIRIADFTAFWAGPYASCLLALLGADVVHVESPKRPDGMRTRSARPPSDPTWLEWSSVYHANNGSKRAISVDLDCPEGLEIGRQLIAACDGAIENFSPRVMDRFGLDGQGVGRIRSDSVYVRMPAFGLENPWRDRPAFQHTIEPIAGIAWISGYPDRDPQPIMICDGLGGVHAAFGMLCGLRHRDRTGKGLHVEVRLSEVAAAIAAEQVVTASARGETLQRIGNRHRWVGPQGVYKCRGDSAKGDVEWVALSVDSDDQWRSLCAVVAGVSEWANASAEERRNHSEDIDLQLALWCAKSTRQNVVGCLAAAGVPVAELSDGRAILQNPQIMKRDFFTIHEHPVCGPMSYPGLPFRVELDDGTRLFTGHRSHAPMWGEHDDQLSSWVQIEDERITTLKSEGVIGRGATNLGPM